MIVKFLYSNLLLLLFYFIRSNMYLHFCSCRLALVFVLRSDFLHLFLPLSPLLSPSHTQTQRNYSGHHLIGAITSLSSYPVGLFHKISNYPSKMGQY